MSDSPLETPAPAHLPAGRHGLSREAVARHQHERMLAATILAAGELGYARMHVEDIVKRAGVSRRTFYEQFSNKEDAFLAAFDAAAAVLVAAVRIAYEREATFPAKVTAGFQAFLGVLATAPEAARVCIVEALAAGEEAIERRTQVMATFAQAIDENARALVGADGVPPLTAETLVGGVYEAVLRRICDGKATELPTLLPDLTELTLSLYLGPEAAAAHCAPLRAGAVDAWAPSETSTFAIALLRR